MSDGLNRFGKRLQLFAIIKSCIYGASGGICLFALLWILYKREIIAMSPLYSALIGLGVALLIGGALFLIIHPTPRRVARYIDIEFSLGERARTMLAYSGGEGAMIELQRNDAESKMASIPTSGLKFKRVWAVCVALALALSFILTGIIVPAVEVEEEIPIIGEYEKNWRIAELKQLITRVSSDRFAEEGLRTGIVTSIENLIGEIETTDQEPKMKLSAINTVKSLKVLLNQYNSSELISRAFLGSGDSIMESIGNAVAKLSDSTLSDALEDMLDAVDSAADASTAMSLYRGKLSAALSSVAISGGTDALYDSLMMLVNGMNNILDGGNEDLDDLCDEVSAAVSLAFLQESDNQRISNIAINEIIRIFSITNDELKEEGVEPPPSTGDTDTPVTPPDDDKDDDLTGDNTGGYGSGDNMVGSDDSVYDPDLDMITKYKEVINKYYSIFDNQSGEIPEEIAEIARKYFDLLLTPEGM